MAARDPRFDGLYRLQCRSEGSLLRFCGHVALLATRNETPRRTTQTGIIGQAAPRWCSTPDASRGPAELY